MVPSSCCSIAPCLPWRRRLSCFQQCGLVCGWSYFEKTQLQGFALFAQSARIQLRCSQLRAVALSVSAAPPLSMIIHTGRSTCEWYDELNASLKEVKEARARSMPPHLLNSWLHHWRRDHHRIRTKHGPRLPHALCSIQLSVASVHSTFLLT